MFHILITTRDVPLNTLYISYLNMFSTSLNGTGEKEAVTIDKISVNNKRPTSLEYYFIFSKPPYLQP